jgi:hypothetical protein
MVDDGGHQLAHIEYPNLPPEEVLESVNRFYDEYYFRPKAIFRIVSKAIFDADERRRLYKEARGFLALRAQRRKYVEEKRQGRAPGTSPPSAEPAGANRSETETEPVNA